MKILPILLFFISTFFVTLDTAAQENLEKTKDTIAQKTKYGLSVWCRPIKTFAQWFGGWVSRF